MSVERRGARNVAQCGNAPLVCADKPYDGYARIHWIHSAAERKPEGKLSALMHHFSEGNLTRAYQQLKGSKAVGIDQVSKAAYRKQLEKNIAQLCSEICRGGWHPKPARTVTISKPQGGTRTLAIGCIEDKIVQTLTAKILGAIYEPRFHRHSYGFRPERSAHQAVRRLHKVIRTRSKKCVVVEVDISKFFDKMNHEWLMKRLNERISDPHFLRLIRRILRNSTLGQDGQVRHNECGTPQGSPASPILANIYLHHLIDTWFAKQYAGRGEMVRYADDVTFVFTDMETAQQFRTELVERLKVGSLSINEDKSSIILFDEVSLQGNVNLLGFTFYWGRKSRRGRMLRVKTSSKSLNRSIKAFSDWIKRYRNRWPLERLWNHAASILRGHYNYFAVTSNAGRVNHFYFATTQALFKWLNRRSQKRSFTGEKFAIRLRKLRTYGSVRSAG